MQKWMAESSPPLEQPGFELLRLVFELQTIGKVFSSRVVHLG